MASSSSAGAAAVAGKAKGSAFKNKPFKDEFLKTIVDISADSKIVVRSFKHTDSKADFSFSVDGGATAVGVKILVAERRKNFESYRFSAKGRYENMVVVLVVVRDATEFPETYVVHGSHALLMGKYEISLKKVAAVMKESYMCASVVQVLAALSRAASGAWKEVSAVSSDDIYRPRKEGTTTIATCGRSELVREWSPKNKNGPDKYLVMSSKRVHWVCGEGHEWEAAVSDRYRGTGCKTCLGRVATKERNFATEPGNSALLEEYSANNALGPHEYTPYSNEIVAWTCAECRFEWHAPLFARTMGKNGCPSCLFNETTPLNCLRAIGDPQIVAELDEQASGFTADDVTQYSRRRATWVCRGCSHTWETSVLARMLGSGCVKCFLGPRRDLTFAAKGDPDMVNEMMVEKSGFAADSVSAWSKRLAWWKCRICSHEWETSFFNRSVGGGCHACASKVVTGANSLRALGDPHIVSELDEEKSGCTADEVVLKSYRHLWWKCRKCKNSWRTAAYCRTRDNTGCPVCCRKGYSKKQMVWLNHVAKTDNTHIQHVLNGGEFKIPSHKSSRYLKVDGYCSESNTVFEFMGTYYHGDIRVYEPEFFNAVVGKTMGQLYDETRIRLEHIRSLGYIVIVKWELDFDADVRSGKIVM